MAIEKLIRVRIENGRLWVPDTSKARELKGHYYIIEEDTFRRLVDGVYNAAKDRDVKEIYIPLDDGIVADVPPFGIPSQISDGDITYYIDRRLMVVPNQVATIRYLTPDVELQELVDEEKRPWITITDYMG